MLRGNIGPPNQGRYAYHPRKLKKAKGCAAAVAAGDDQCLFYDSSRRVYYRNAEGFPLPFYLAYIDLAVGYHGVYHF